MPGFLIDLLNIITNEFKVVFTAALPIIEVRGAIPVGIALGMSPLHATIIAFLGSITPVPFILFGIRPIFKYLKTTKIFKKVIYRITSKSIAKSANIMRFGYLGLFLFVAIPLPGTGVWSGSLIAVLLDMRFKYAFPTILLGNLIASIAIMILSFGFISLFGLSIS